MQAPHIVAPASSQFSDCSLDELGDRIRQFTAQFSEVSLTALGIELDCGDALNEAQGRVSGSWQAWRGETCSLGKSTAELFQQLARNRDKIEAEMSRFPNLSIRAARKLISTPKPKEPKTEKLVPDWVSAFKQAPAAERTRGLALLKLSVFLAAMPASMIAELERRIRGLDKEWDGGEPDTRLTNILRTALSHLASADDPKASPPVVLSQERAALVALRGIARLHPDFHDLAVGVREPRRRRAA